MQFFKAILVIGVLVTYVCVTVVLLPVFLIAQNFTRKYILINIVHYVCRIFLKIINTKIETSGEFDVRPGTVVIANHVSYLDILIMSALKPGCFMSTKEIREMKLIGRLVELAGCVFIERRNRNNRDNEVSDCIKVMKNGMNIVFFPEARSTNGDEIIRFKKPFFVLPVNMKSDILLVTNNFRTVSGQKITQQNRDKVFWYRQCTIFKHAWDLFKETELTVHSHGTIIKYDDYSKVMDEQHVANQAYEIALNQYDKLIPQVEN